MIALLISTNLFAFDCEVDGIYYNRLSTDEFEVTYGTNKYTGDVVIPETVTFKERTFKVIQIGSMAFKDCQALTSVSIPQSVISIENSAFSGCISLTTFVVPESVTVIGNYLFKTVRN